MPLAQLCLLLFKRCLAFVLLLSALTVAGQSSSSEYNFPSRNWPSRSSVPLVARRWLLSNNPFGLLEPAAALGAGFGYRYNHGVEFWSETSLLWLPGKPSQSNAGTISGWRQILQVKLFFDKDGALFVAGEVRYKNFTHRLYSDFVDTVARSVMKNVLTTSYHKVYGAALQLGYREALRKDGRFVLEATIGLGIKKKVISWPGIPAGYVYRRQKIDVNVWDEMETSDGKPAIYLPGSLRIIYMFGRKVFNVRY